MNPSLEAELASAHAEVDRLNELRKWRAADDLPSVNTTVLMSADPGRPAANVFTAIRHEEVWLVNTDGFVDPRVPSELVAAGYTWCYIPGHEHEEGTPE